MEPGSAPMLMELLKWGLAGFKGSDSVEGILDQAISKMNATADEGSSEQPDPEQIKAQAEQQSQQFDMQKLDKTHAFEREKMAHELQMAQFEDQSRAREQQSDNQIKQNQEQAQATLNKDEESHETLEYIKREEASARINGTNKDD